MACLILRLPLRRTPQRILRGAIVAGGRFAWNDSEGVLVQSMCAQAERRESPSLTQLILVRQGSFVPDIPGLNYFSPQLRHFLAFISTGSALGRPTSGFLRILP